MIIRIVVWKNIFESPKEIVSIYETKATYRSNGDPTSSTMWAALKAPLRDLKELKAKGEDGHYQVVIIDATPPKLIRWSIT